MARSIGKRIDADGKDVIKSDTVEEGTSMPKHFSFYLGPISGVNITWTPSNRKLRFDGWTDDLVEVKGPSFRLGTLLQELGITEDDVRKALMDVGNNEVVSDA